MAVHKALNLKAGYQVGFLTEKIKMKAGTYSQGELIEFDTVTGKGGACTTATKFYGVATDNVTLEEGAEMTVYITGVFNSRAIVKTIELKEIKELARKLNIYFVEGVIASE